MTSPSMARAIELAIESVRANRGGPFGAVVVKDGKIIAVETDKWAKVVKATGATAE